MVDVVFVHVDDLPILSFDRVGNKPAESAAPLDDPCYRSSKHDIQPFVLFAVLLCAVFIVGRIEVQGKVLEVLRFANPRHRSPKYRVWSLVVESFIKDIEYRFKENLLELDHLLGRIRLVTFKLNKLCPTTRKLSLNSSKTYWVIAR